jgi:hypothetical protein
MHTEYRSRRCGYSTFKALYPISVTGQGSETQSVESHSRRFNEKVLQRNRYSFRHLSLPFGNKKRFELCSVLSFRLNKQRGLAFGVCVD